MKYKSVTFKTMQGIGDIIWCLQRLYPYFEKVNIRIMEIGGQVEEINRVQKRSENFISRILPDFVESVEMWPCNDAEYQTLNKGDFFVGDIIGEYEKDPVAAEHKVFDFSSNHQLEQGWRLNELEPGMSIEETLPLYSSHADIAFEEWVTVYVSGSKAGLPTWSVTEWVDYVDKLYAKFNLTLPVVVTGAKFDIGTINTLGFMLEQKGYRVTYFVGQSAEYVIDLLKRTELFIGYQSGLNIICDQLDTPQIMLYFAELQKLRTAWPKQKNMDNGTHQIFGFDSSPDEVVEKTKIVGRA